MKKLEMLRLSFILFLVLFFSCSKSRDIKQFGDLHGKKFGVKSGTIIDEITFQIFPRAKMKYYPQDKIETMLVDLKKRRIDTIIDDLPVLQTIVINNEHVRILYPLISIENYALATRLNNVLLKDQMDIVIYELQTNGTFEEMMARWFPENGVYGEMPVFNLKPGIRTLRFGTSPTVEPFAFLDQNNNLVGLDIEIAHHIAKKFRMELDIRYYPFNNLVTELENNNVDFIGACLTITSNRQERILFSTPYYKGGVAALIRN